ncbi:hypothetical protein LCGC14_0603870 [marine sediment metagenome]|uniref:Uncharacterized protein n=1 Tax=marine sediment metagenome TaxID=412755 RepID=A0A0F9RTS5_9ZZZZ
MQAEIIRALRGQLPNFEDVMLRVYRVSEVCCE